jgi:hypothetical protein
MPISIPDNTAIELIPQDRAFIELVDNRITMYKQIPYTVPEKLIIDIIKESARYFFRHHWKATQKIFYRLDRSEIIDFTTANPAYGYENMRGYMVTLPSAINVVYEIHEPNKPGSSIFKSVFDSVNAVTGISTRGNTILGINNALYAIEVAAKLVEQNAFNSVFGESVPFSFNNLTHQLYINKKIDTPALLLEVLANVHIQILYNDDLFIRHVIGRTKQELKRLIASHTIQLPGEVTLNAEEICNNIEDVEKVEELLKQAGGIGDIIMMR